MLKMKKKRNATGTKPTNAINSLKLILPSPSASTSTMTHSLSIQE
jgi:hypothetical protein